MVRQNGENRTRNGHVLVWEQPGILDMSDRVKQRGKLHRASVISYIYIYTYISYIFSEPRGPCTLSHTALSYIYSHSLSSPLFLPVNTLLAF